MDHGGKPERGLWADIKGDGYVTAAYLLIVLAAIVILQMQGRVWWCQAGDITPWSWNIWSTHNSQHIVDPYSFTHVLHGVLEFWLIGLVFRRMPLAWRLALAVFIESAWEVAENSAAVIERYRSATISLDYFGDSIINSVADIACCSLGFVIAYKLRFWRSLALFVVTEILLIIFIKDSLIINIIMLLFPVEAIKTWQLGH
ncbi:MAG: DUF2585 family protein [Pyrinomonadaceae bacterium]|nr:DUF2585 family protein [Pyrinomonadaceae bacterium]